MSVFDQLLLQDIKTEIHMLYIPTASFLFILGGVGGHLWKEGQSAETVGCTTTKWNGEQLSFLFALSLQLIYRNKSASEASFYT